MRIDEKTLVNSLRETAQVLMKLSKAVNVISKRLTLLENRRPPITDTTLTKWICYDCRDPEQEENDYYDD